MTSKSAHTFLLALSLLGAVSASACRTDEADRTPADWTKQQARELRLAGERLGVPIRTESMVQFAQFGAAGVAAPPPNLETIPATPYPAGADIGVPYLDLPGPGSAKG